jgi:hypothetical protein
MNQMVKAKESIEKLLFQLASPSRAHKFDIQTIKSKSTTSIRIRTEGPLWGPTMAPPKLASSPWRIKFFHPDRHYPRPYATLNTKTTKAREPQDDDD